MEEQLLKLECVKQAALVVSSMPIDKKGKATIDLAEELYQWITKPK